MFYKNQLILTEISDTGRPVRMNSGKSYRAGLELDAAYHSLQNSFGWQMLLLAPIKIKIL